MKCCNKEMVPFKTSTAGMLPAKSTQKSKFAEILIYIYFALTFFEPYLNGVWGSVTKYYILFVIFVVFVQNNFRIKIQSYIIPFVVWLLYRFITLLWTDNFSVFQMHVFSQIGMVALLVTLTMQTYESKTIDNIVKIIWVASFTISLFAIFWGQSYLGVVEQRQVLVLFGQEVDPNNQAAFALVGISIALYYLFYGKKYIFQAFVTLFVNAVSMFMTGSRGGLVSMLPIVLFIIVFNEKGNKIFTIFKKIFLFACVLSIVLIIFKNYIPQNISERLFDVKGYEDGSERTFIWENGLKLLTENLNFIFGVGWGDYYGYNGFYIAMHNTYLTILCDVGILGFLVFFSPIVLTSIWCIKKKEYLPVMLLLAGLGPALFIDAINKRIFWNGIIYIFIFYAFYSNTQKSIIQEK